MSISEQEQNIVLKDSLRQQPDTIIAVQENLTSGQPVMADSVRGKKVTSLLRSEKVKFIDTASVSTRNTISDITFYDSTNFILKSVFDNRGTFPFLFIDQNNKIETGSRFQFTGKLKDGVIFTEKSLNDDWIIIAIVCAAFLYSAIRAGLAKVFSDFSKFFLFRGIGDPSSRDTGALFHLNSTLLNLVSFANIALFIYCIAFSFDIIPSGSSGFKIWLATSGFVAGSVTARHIICFASGRISGETEAFAEYVVTIYHSYRYSALIMLVLVILISYTSFLPVNFLLYIGILMFVLLYLMRLIRLFFIFMKQNISILYLILYLCALEFLPVVVLIKFFTGLF
jgi:hypothetical protein